MSDIGSCPSSGVANAVETFVASRVKFLSNQTTKENQTIDLEPIKAKRSALVESRLKWLSRENLASRNEDRCLRDKENTVQKPVQKNHPKSAVQLRKEGIEEKEAELRRFADPKNFHKASWRSAGYSQYKRKITDVRGVAPKKTLAQLP